jgi:hypothetical protein
MAAACYFSVGPAENVDLLESNRMTRDLAASVAEKTRNDRFPRFQLRFCPIDVDDAPTQDSGDGDKFVSRQ